MLTFQCFFYNAILFHSFLFLHSLSSALRRVLFCMPSVSVPLTRFSSTWRFSRQKLPYDQSSISISYRVQGTGPVLVLLVPGLCVPASMYDSMAAVLSATSQFTAVTMDNRGMGLSDAPISNVFGGLGYNIADVAADAWAVVDCVVKDVALARRESMDDFSVPTSDHSTEVKGFQSKSHHHNDASDTDEQPSEASNEETPFQVYPQVALVGHSMGGMIVQQMITQRPSCVRFVALLSTHAGGYWNLMPTYHMLTSLGRIVCSGFDRDVNAAVNLSLHFTQRFLDSWVAPDLDFHNGASHTEDDQRPQRQDNISAQNRDLRHDAADRENHANADPVTASDTEDEQHPQKRDTTAAKKLDSPNCEGDGHINSTKEPLVPEKHLDALGYFESKMLELVHDAQVYFGLSDDLKASLWKPQKAILKAIEKRRRARRRRRDIYHDRYTGAEQSNSTERTKVDHPASKAMTNPEDSPYALFGHMAVVRSHILARSTAWKLKQCTRLVKLVMLGRHDKVVTPSSSRALADSIGANTVVEVEAAHFITDEAAAEVTTHIMYGLRKAYFAPRSKVACECDWCAKTEKDEESEASSCRIC